MKRKENEMIESEASRLFLSRLEALDHEYREIANDVIEAKRQIDQELLFYGIK